MAEFYSNSSSRSRRSRRKRYSRKEVALFLCDLLATLLMLVLVFSTVTAIIAQYISPERSGVLSVLALGAPIIYLLDIVVMFYWIVRWRWYRAVIMVAVVVLGLFYLSRYYKLELDRQYDTTYIERRFFKIMSYNVHKGEAEELYQYIEKHNPDILCLQEIFGEANLEALKEKYNSTKNNGDGIGNQIFTRYRIIRRGVVEGLSRQNCVWADLRIKEDTVRVLSLHLQSTSIRPEDTQFIEELEYIHDKERENKLRSIFVRLIDRNRKRAVQADAIAAFLAKSPYQTVVCGDFNDVPLSYTYNTIVEGFDDTFSKMARGFAYTYDTRYGLFRIDNILVSPSIEVVSYEVDNKVNLSDHYPVISRVKFNLKR